MYFDSKLKSFTIALALTATFLHGTPVLAAKLPLSLEEFRATAEGAYLLTKAPRLESLILRLTGKTAAQSHSREQLVDEAIERLERPDFARARAELEERFRQVSENFQREMKTRSETGELTREQKLWLNQAASHFKVNPEWRPGGERIEFFVKTPFENYRSTRSRFLKPDPALSDDGSYIPVSERSAMRKVVATELEAMKKCVVTRPSSERSKFNMKFVTGQLMLDELATGAGSIVAAGGISGVDWKTLPSDLAFEAFDSVGQSFISTLPKTSLGNGKVDIRWWTMQKFGAVGSSVDAIVYSISKSENQVSTPKRFAYHAAWNTGSAAFNVRLFDLLEGMDCRDYHPAIVVGTAIGGTALTSVAYFKFRDWTIGRNND